MPHREIPEDHQALPQTTDERLAEPFGTCAQLETSGLTCDDLAGIDHENTEA